MRGQIAITETKPGRQSVGFHFFKTSKCFITHAPAADRIEFSGKTVRNGIDVRTDVESPDVRIVADIHDHMNVLFGNDLDEAAQEFCSAGSTGKNSVVGGSHPIILRGTQG